MSDSFLAWLRGVFARRQIAFPVPLEAIEANRIAAAAALPFERIETTGQDALATWERLRLAGRGWPVVVGDDHALGILAEGWSGDDSGPDAILAVAATIAMPGGLRDLRESELKTFREFLGKDGSSDVLPDPADRHGDWPEVPPPPTALTVAYDHRNRPHPKVHILLIPTKTGAEVPAYLRWGGWNENPGPEHHVAALRYWHERYGAELVGIGSDVLNLRVARPPQTRDDALALAEEHFIYCEDIVDQGTETLEMLAASLLAHDWWYFWWD